MDIISAIFLGLIQGFTEWLPISSSGHLVIAQALFGIDAPAEFDIVIMAGTTLALLIYFRQKIISLFFGLLKFDKPSVNYLMFMAIAGVPTALIGFPGRGFFKGLFSSPLAVCLFIVLTGVFLFFVSRKKPEKQQDLNSGRAALIGLAQGIAIAPGISRSGSTIGTGILLGLAPKDAAEFSFLIGAPAMAVASLLEFSGSVPASSELPAFALGTIAAFIAGYISIGFFMKILQENKLHFFAYYCMGAGIIFALLTILMNKA